MTEVENAPAADNLVGVDETEKDARIAELEAELDRIRQTQTNPSGPNYDPTQNPSLVPDSASGNPAGTQPVAPDPNTLGYHPHEGDHSINPFTGTID